MQLSAPLKLDLGEVDEIASLLKQMLRAVGDNRVVQVVLLFGEKMQGVAPWVCGRTSENRSREDIGFRYSL
jgi:hypothetical protein